MFYVKFYISTEIFKSTIFINIMQIVNYFVHNYIFNKIEKNAMQHGIYNIHTMIYIHTII